MKACLKEICDGLDHATTEAAGAEDWERRILGVLYRAPCEHERRGSTIKSLLADMKTAIGDQTGGAK